MDGSPDDLKGEEGDFGLVTARWDTTDLSDGSYDLRLASTCGGSNDVFYPTLAGAASSIFPGVIDRWVGLALLRTPPRGTPSQALFSSQPIRFGLPQPVDGHYVPGDDILLR